MANNTQTARFKQEKERLTELFSGLPSSKMALAEPLIERAAWMRVQCEDLEKYLQKNGWTSPFQQSEKLEPYDRARPQGQTYQTLNANYQKIIRQLERMLPQSSAEADDGFEAFVESNDE